MAFTRKRVAEAGTAKWVKLCPCGLGKWARGAPVAREKSGGPDLWTWKSVAQVGSTGPVGCGHTPINPLPTCPAASLPMLWGHPEVPQGLHMAPRLGLLMAWWPSRLGKGTQSGRMLGWGSYQLPASCRPSWGLWAPVLLCGQGNPGSWLEGGPSPCSWFWMQLGSWEPRSPAWAHSHLSFRAWFQEDPGLREACSSYVPLSPIFPI